MSHISSTYCHFLAYIRFIEYCGDMPDKILDPEFREFVPDDLIAKFHRQKDYLCAIAREVRTQVGRAGGRYLGRLKLAVLEACPKNLRRLEPVHVEAICLSVQKTAMRIIDDTRRMERTAQANIGKNRRVIMCACPSSENFLFEDRHSRGESLPEAEL